MDLTRFLNLHRFMFSILGIWPESKLSNPSVFVPLFITFGLSLLILISLTVEMILRWNTGELEAVVDGMFYYMTHACYCFKLSAFCIQRDKFQRLMRMIRSPVFEPRLPEQRRFVRKWLAVSNLFSYSFLVVCNVCVLFFCIAPLIDQNEDNILPLGGWFPFDVRSNMTNRIIIYVVQFIGQFISVEINANMDSLSTGCMNFGCGQIEMLKYKLETVFHQVRDQVSEKDVKLLSEEMDDFVHDAIFECVKHHRAIIKYIRLIEDIFTYGMFAQFCASGLVICLAGFQLIVQPFNFQYIPILLYFGAMVVQIAAYCWNGHQVIVESSSIGDSCYKLEWYRCSERVKKKLYMIIIRTRDPLFLAAGNYFTLSIDTLMKILRVAYSSFTLLQNSLKK